jgi:Cu/Zn superoxide dismutase
LIIVYYFSIGIVSKYELSGTLFLYQAAEQSELVITGVVYNVDPDGLHGFHVHQFGNLSDSCKGAGGHFNPTGVSFHQQLPFVYDVK